MKRLIPLILCGPLIAMTGCTNSQVAAWLNWYSQDPDAAVDFAEQDHIQQQLRERSSPAPQRSQESSDDNGDDDDDSQSESRDESRESSPTTSSGGGSGKWAPIVECESGGNWSANTGNGYYGGLQFALQSWRAAGGSGMPHHASPSEQIRVAERLLDMQGWGAWPTCARQAGYL